MLVAIGLDEVLDLFAVDLERAGGEGLDDGLQGLNDLGAA
jgi:hypothetical protein